MSDVLIRIKRAVLAGQYAFSEKARSELEADCLTGIGCSRVDTECRRNLQTDPFPEPVSSRDARIPLHRSGYQPGWSPNLFEG